MGGRNQAACDGYERWVVVCDEYIISRNGRVCEGDLEMDVHGKID